MGSKEVYHLVAAEVKELATRAVAAAAAATTTTTATAAIATMALLVLDQEAREVTMEAVQRLAARGAVGDWDQMQQMRISACGSILLAAILNLRRARHEMMEWSTTLTFR